jgi:hypothetical protein
MAAARPPEWTGQQTLIEMHHPEFKRGYQEGRNISFQQATAPLTDKQLVECLASLVQDGLFTDGDQASDYYTLGQFIGQLSGAVIPRQPYESDEEARKQQLLARLRATYGKSEQLIEAVSTFWGAQDMLVQVLDAETYEDVLHRNARPVLKIVE